MDPTPPPNPLRGGRAQPSSGILLDALAGAPASDHVPIAGWVSARAVRGTAAGNSLEWSPITPV